jgi:hypothetical protein
MEMESQLLPISQERIGQTSASTDQLIREWLFRFAVEHKEDAGPKLPLWLEAFGGMDAASLERLFSRALRTYKFFPKVSEILAPLVNAEANAAPEAAERAWARVLEIRRVDWNPDIPGPFNRAVAGLSERVRQAARAAGVFRDFESAEALHTWAKKRFVESFMTWGELEQNKFLLPDGEVKKLMAGVAETKALPASDETYDEMRERGLAYAAQLKSSPADLSRGRQSDTPRLRPCSQAKRSLEEQKRILRERGWLPKTEPQAVVISGSENGGARV